MAAPDPEGRLESSLLVAVPEAEPAIGAWRRYRDPSAALGVPAHITLLYPFRPPDTLDAKLFDELRASFAAVRPFRFTLAVLARFPEVLYLAPEPAEPFSRLIAALTRRYPDTPPYGGMFETVTPHLTIAHTADLQMLDRAEEALTDCLPIDALAHEVLLMAQDQDEYWRVRARFPLGGGQGESPGDDE